MSLFKALMLIGLSVGCGIAFVEITESKPWWFQVFGGALISLLALITILVCIALITM